MFLRQNFIFCRLRLRGSGVWGSVWGRCCPADGLRVIKRLRWLFFEVVRISAKKARISKNVMLYNFFTFFQGLISFWFRVFFGGYELARGRKGLYITLFSADFRYFLIWASFQAWFRRVLRPACRPAVAGGADSVKLRDDRLYMYVLFSVYSILK